MYYEMSARRIKVVALLVLLTVIALVGRLFYFQVVAASSLNDQSKSFMHVNGTIPAIRGDIKDANGNVLATTVLSWDVNIDPSAVGPVMIEVNGTKTPFTKEQAAQKLADILRIPVESILAKFTGVGKYANLKKNVNVMTFSQLDALNIPWLWLERKQSRHYANGAVAGNLLGFMGSDGVALAGLERTMNSCMAGVDGKETYIQGADYIKIPSSIQTITPVQNGGELVLTINQDLQYAAQQEMASTVRRLHADWASAIVIEVKTGKILAAAEAPSVDPNNPGGVSAANRHSRIFQAAFEPGSILKTVAAATAIDTGKATPTTRVTAPDKLRMPWGQYINDAEIHKPEKLTLAGVLMNSSNTGLVQIGGKVDSATRYHYMQKFGMGS
ncbi:MAG: hypothetical protein RIQ88_91, partial [Actinomycetota bacterium]